MSILKYVPFDRIELLEEGQFLQLANAKLQELIAKLLEFHEEHEGAAVGSHIGLTLKVKLKIASIDKNGTMVLQAITSLKGEEPSRPDRASLVLAQADTESGKMEVFVQEHGSHKDDPRQGKLFKEDMTPIE